MNSVDEQATEAMLKMMDAEAMEPNDELLSDMAEAENPENSEADIIDELLDDASIDDLIENPEPTSTDAIARIEETAPESDVPVNENITNSPSSSAQKAIEQMEEALQIEQEVKEISEQVNQATQEATQIALAASERAQSAAEALQKTLEATLAAAEKTIQAAQNAGIQLDELQATPLDETAMSARLQEIQNKNNELKAVNLALIAKISSFKTQ
ncbi:hypothetical protein [Thiomicrorhabdus sp.]|uniref:hypothetical protein n=1 Tax=Thiomicrorhabdus sp. TaxID=2039724 RepID=UPI0029C7145B|nr:hypothetical protein [Thiomicrorhabdus sp.]